MNLELAISGNFDQIIDSGFTNEFSIAAIAQRLLNFGMMKGKTLLAMAH